MDTTYEEWFIWMIVSEFFTSLLRLFLVRCSEGYALNEILVTYFHMPSPSPPVISSQHNPHFKRWLSLLETPGIKRHQQCLVSGERIVTELIKHAPKSIIELLIASRNSHPQPITMDFTGTKHHLANSLFQQLDIFGTHAPLAISRIPTLPPYNLTGPPKGLEVLCPMGDPGNLGSLLRGCWIFGVDQVILMNESVHPFHPKVIRASSGAVFLLSLNRGCSMGELGQPEIARWITALDIGGANASTWAWEGDTRLLIGEEGMGIPPASFAQRLTIPQVQTTIPLNASVAGHIAIYAYRQHHPFKTQE